MSQAVKRVKEKLRFYILEHLAARQSFARYALLGRVPRFSALSTEAAADYRARLYQTAKQLQHAGWPVIAIRQFVRSAVEIGKNEPQAGLISAEKQVRLVGSNLFQTMLKTAYPSGGDQGKQTLILLFRLLGARIDDHSFLQLEQLVLQTDLDTDDRYQFTTDIVEAIAFDHLIAQFAQQVYPDGINDDGSLASVHFAQMTHQFRYYLDWKNNEAMRASYPESPTDLARLQAHQRRFGNLVGEKARFHNKYQGKSAKYPSFIAKHGENVKYVTTPYFHSEWIVDQNGAFVTQWNAYQLTIAGNVMSDPTYVYTWEEQRQIVDGNSANFANDSHDYRTTSYGVRNLHTLLDAAPVSQYDPAVRRIVMKRWRSPVLTPGEIDYFDTKASEQKANALLRGEA